MLTNKMLKNIRTGNESKFYKSRTWQKKRNEIVIRDHYECQRCKEKGKYSKADCVHHIIYLKDNPYLALENSNLVSLCNHCHYLEHNEKLNKMIESNKKEPITPERW